MLFDTQHCRSTLGKNNGFGYIFGFGLVWSPYWDLKDMDFLCNFKIKIESQIQIICEWKNSDHIQINIRMQNPSQEPPVSSKSPNQDLKDMVVLITFKINIKSRNLVHGCIKDEWQNSNQDKDAKPQSGTSSVLIINL